MTRFEQTLLQILNCAFGDILHSNCLQNVLFIMRLVGKQGDAGVVTYAEYFFLLEIVQNWVPDHIHQQSLQGE